MKLADKSLAFARCVGERWQDQPAMDLPSFQRRYLYVQSFGAAHTARSYWILHRAKQHNDCNVLARNLLERIFNSRVAAKSPKHAVELIAYELSKRISGLRRLLREHQRLPKKATETIERHESELKVFLSLLGTQSVPQWDYYRRASVAGISSWAYRGLYSGFSCYTHADYGVSRPQDSNKPSSFADFIALLAPVETALFLHAPACTDTSCEVGLRYKALCDEFSNKTLEERISEDG